MTTTEPNHHDGLPSNSNPKMIIKQKLVSLKVCHETSKFRKTFVTIRLGNMNNVSAVINEFCKMRNIPHPEQYRLVIHDHYLVQNKSLQENQLDTTSQLFPVTLMHESQVLEHGYTEQRLVKRKERMVPAKVYVPPPTPVVNNNNNNNTNVNNSNNNNSNVNNNSDEVSTNSTLSTSTASVNDPTSSSASSSSNDTSANNKSSDNNNATEESSSSSSAATTAGDGGDAEAEKKKKKNIDIKLRIQEKVNQQVIGCDITAKSGMKFEKIQVMYCNHRKYNPKDYVFASYGVLMEPTKTLNQLGLNQAGKVYTIQVYNKDRVNIADGSAAQ